MGVSSDVRKHPISSSVKRESKRVACNNGAGGSTERHFVHQTHFTEPQGKIKNLNTPDRTAKEKLKIGRDTFRRIVRRTVDEP